MYTLEHIYNTGIFLPVPAWVRIYIHSAASSMEGRKDTLC